MEINLYYNRFRYYDSDSGNFISHDPIGLLGGQNPFLYAPNPIEWIDELGLSRMPTRQGYQRQHIVPYSVWASHPFTANTARSVNGATNMMYMPVNKGIDKNPLLGLHRGWTTEHAAYNAMVQRKLNVLERQANLNNWDQLTRDQKLLDLQNELRNGTKTGKYTCALPK
ncbi:hypothetical protein G9F32_16440 [Acinetobacter sp. 194]|uniref:RHS repeat-associated core domain-containing protein n=1 Tax=Acinetobacter shaoyimingii TaxID=2715164 RepID=UPI0014099251|nr:RHS repeat-associated core domain-containing protein [Acinetobacter shaoyimingii]NHB59583.1 hypothetical protein [Acinetobacter shaoyimingii]